MPKLLSGGVLRSGGSGEFIALPGAQPALLPTPSTSTGFTLILDAQQKLTYSNRLGDIAFNSGTITALIPDGNLTLAATGTGSLIFDSDAFFNKNVTFANTFTFTDLTASGLIRFTNTSTSSVWNDGAVVISGSLGVGRDVNLNGPLNVFSSTNFFTDVSIAPIGYNVDISPKIGGLLTINPDTTGNIDNMVIGFNNPDDGYFTNLSVLNQFAITSTASSISTQTGALVVTGGVGVGENLYALEIYDNYKRTVTEVDIQVGNGLGIVGASTATGPTVGYFLTNTGVTSITAGLGIVINTSTGDVTIATTGNTLQDVTNAGNSTTNVILFQNTGTATSVSTASIVIDGGVAIKKNLIVGGSITAGSFAGLGTFERIAVTSNLANTTTLVNNSLYTVGGVGVGTDLTVFGNEFIYGSLTILGTLTTVVSTIADVGRKVIALSTSAGPAILAAESGITVGPISSPFVKFMFDGVSNWRTTGGINPVTNNSYNLGSPSLNWNILYANRGIFSSVTSATTTQTGAVTIAGGLGVGGSIYASRLHDGGNRVLTSFTANPGVGLSGGGVVTAVNNTFTFTNTGVLSITAGTGTVVSNTTGNVTISVDAVTSTLQGVTNNGNTTTNSVHITNFTDAVSTNTGALTVKGGAGFGGDIYARSYRIASGALAITTEDLLTGNILTVGTDTAISTSSNIITIWNTSTLQTVTSRGNTTDQLIYITNATASTTTNNGALVVTGGVGIGGSLRVGGETVFSGPVTFNEAATYVYTTNTYVTDNIIELHVPAGGAGTDWGSNDGKDIGVRFNYYGSYPARAFLGRNNADGYLEWFEEGNESVGGTFAGTYGTFKTGSIQLTNATTSTSPITGALIVTGGAGIGGDLYVNGFISGTVANANTLKSEIDQSSSTRYITFSNSTSSYSTGYVNESLTFNPGTGLFTLPSLYVSATTLASSTETGAVVIAGGLGVGDSIYGTNIYSNGSQVITQATLGNYGVSAIFAGTDTAINTSTGAVTIWNTSTLNSVTSRGATTTNAIFVGSATTTQLRTEEIYSPGILGIYSVANLNLNTVQGKISVLNNTGELSLGGATDSTSYLTYRAQALFLSSSTGITLRSNDTGSGNQDWVFDTTGYTKFPSDTLKTPQTSGLKISSGQGTVEFINDTQSTSTGTGAVKILGGLGVGGNIYARNIVDNGNRVVSFVQPAGSTYIGIESVISTGTTASFVVTNLGVQTLTAGTDTAVSSTTGTVVVWNTSNLNSVTGRGATTTNAISVGTATTPLLITDAITPASGTLTVNANTTATLLGAGALVINAGGAYIGNNLVINGNAGDLNTTASNALYVAGGAHIANSLRVEGPVLFASNVIFNGTSTNVYSTNTVYTDNLINMHVPAGSTGTDHTWLFDDGKDIGLVFHYYKTADKNGFLGFANNSTYLEWYSDGVETPEGAFTSATYGTFKTGSIKLVGGESNQGNTSTGDLTVLGGAGIGENLYVGGDAIVTGTIYGAVTNIKGGSIGSIPIQASADFTAFIPLGISGQVLTAGINTATWQSVSGLTAGTATNALNVAVTTTNISAVYFPTFVTTSSGFSQIVADLDLTYNPVTDVLALASQTDSTSTTTGALVVSGGVGIGKSLNVNYDVTIEGSLNLNATARQSVFTDTFGAATAGLEQDLDSWSTLDYRSAKYFIQITDAGFSPARVHVTELSIFHDSSSNAYTTEYGIHYNVGTLGIFNATVATNILQFKFTPNSIGLVPNLLTVKLVRTLLTI